MTRHVVRAPGVPAPRRTRPHPLTPQERAVRKARLPDEIEALYWCIDLAEAPITEGELGQMTTLMPGRVREACQRLAEVGLIARAGPMWRTTQTIRTSCSDTGAQSPVF